MKFYVELCEKVKKKKPTIQLMKKMQNDKKTKNIKHHWIDKVNNK